MAKIWKVAQMKMDTLSMKVLIIIIIVMMTAKMYWLRHQAKHFTWTSSLNSHNSSM